MKNSRSVKEYAEQQYKIHENLSNRMNLWSFGTNPVSLHKWIFSKIKLKNNERILELGCGTGQLWLENFRKIPLNCSIVLSDFSKNMLKTAKKDLANLKLPIKFKIINAENIPYPNQSFDVILACHMLYHIPNIEKALTEISRVIKPNGRFISTTVSKNHIKELKDFLFQFDLDIEMKNEFFSEFRNETGNEILQQFFNEIELFEYINPVNISSIELLMKYIESMFQKGYYPHFQEIKPDIEKKLIKIINNNSVFKMKGISGLFQARKPKTSNSP
ncbi:MAG: class I SAM-dependent methyltransferase [Candidatus Hermodarchaeota archaeon]